MGVVKEASANPDFCLDHVRASSAICRTPVEQISQAPTIIEHDTITECDLCSPCCSRACYGLSHSVP
jgi:hypothetical protein